jgi:hypothetical protein
MNNFIEKECKNIYMRLVISEYAALRVTCPKPGETLTIPTIKVNCDSGPFGVENSAGPSVVY